MPTDEEEVPHRQPDAVPPAQGVSPHIAMPADRRRTRLMLGLILGLVVTVALVGSLFIFGRESEGPRTPAIVASQTAAIQGTASPTAETTLPASPTIIAATRAVPQPVVTRIPALPTSVETGMPAPLPTAPLPVVTVITPVGSVTPGATLAGSATAASPSTTATRVSPPTQVIPQAVPSSVSTAGIR